MYWRWLNCLPRKRGRKILPQVTEDFSILSNSKGKNGVVYRVEKSGIY